MGKVRVWVQGERQDSMRETESRVIKAAQVEGWGRGREGRGLSGERGEWRGGHFGGGQSCVIGGVRRVGRSQEREELQRQGDELDQKIQKSEREIRALEKTLQHLFAKNAGYKRSLEPVSKAAPRYEQKVPRLVGEGQRGGRGERERRGVGVGGGMGSGKQGKGEEGRGGTDFARVKERVRREGEAYLAVRAVDSGGGAPLGSLQVPIPPARAVGARAGDCTISAHPG